MHQLEITIRMQQCAAIVDAECADDDVGQLADRDPER